MAKLEFYLWVYLTSSVKFLFGPAAAGSKLTVFEAFVCTVLGMMTTVFIVSNFGVYLRRKFFKKPKEKRKLFTKRNRMIVRVWRTYGLFGIAFLTPVIFSPIIGTMIAVSLGEKRKKIYFNMLFSAIFWGFIVSFLTVKLGIDLPVFLSRLLNIG